MASTIVSPAEHDLVAEAIDPRTLGDHDPAMEDYDDLSDADDYPYRAYCDDRNRD